MSPKSKVHPSSEAAPKRAKASLLGIMPEEGSACPATLRRVESPKSGEVSSVECRVSSEGRRAPSRITPHASRNTGQGTRNTPLRFGASMLQRFNAFTLIEVMIALGIFFMAVFTILALVSTILRNARGLQRPQVDAGLAAARYVNTNRFPEGTVSGELGDSLSDYSYEIDTEEFATNGLMQAEIVLSRRGSRQPPDTLSILVFDPNYQSTPFSGRK